MNDHRWKKFNPLWPSLFGTNFEFPAAPAQPVDEPTAQPPTYAFYPSSPPPATSWNEALTHLADRAAPIFPEPPGSSPNVDARGGFLGDLAQAAKYFDPAKYRRTAPAPVRASRRPPEPQSRSSWSASASNPDGERGTSYGGGNESIPEILSDVTPDNHWIPGADYAADGHHEFPQAHYKNPHAHYKNMPRETRKVFDEAKTGRLVYSIDGRRHEFDKFHRQYNSATGELLEGFMKENNIAERYDLLTPDHARAVLKANRGIERSSHSALR